jgi:hypothetical protein
MAWFFWISPDAKATFAMHLLSQSRKGLMSPTSVVRCASFRVAHSTIRQSPKDPLSVEVMSILKINHFSSFGFA